MNEMNVKVYPSAPDADGWQYLNAGAEATGIMTRVSDNGDDTQKKVLLTGGRYLIVRELTGKECKQAKAIADNDSSKIEEAYAALASTMYSEDGTVIPFVMEDLAGWKAKDYNKILLASGELNF
jgi:hypothetical protein